MKNVIKFFIAFLAMTFVVNNSSYAQLPCEGNTNVLPSNKLISTNGCYDIAALIGTGTIPSPDVIKVDISKVDLTNTHIGTESLTNPLWYGLPEGGPPSGYTIYMNYLPLWAPGPLGVGGNEGEIIANINFIDDPLVTTDGNASGRLLGHTNGQGNIVITVNSSVVVTVGNQFFVTGSGNTQFYRKVNGDYQLVSSGLGSYLITQSGEYGYLTQDMKNPAVQIPFEVVIQPQTVPVSEVSVTPTAKTIAVGEKFTPVATVQPANATNKNVTWSSSNANVATVNPTTGEVTGIVASNATITATTQDGGFTASCDVTVQNVTVSVIGVNVTPTSKTLVVGEKFTPTAAVAPDNATNKTVTWSSNNVNVAAVNPTTGEVTGIVTGNATITATTQDGGFTASCDVTVQNVTVSVIGVNVTPTSKTLVVGEKFTLTATVAPSNATNQTVTWSSSNPSVATVSNGEVTALAAGTATVTVTTQDGEFTASCAVTVSAAKRPHVYLDCLITNNVVKIQVVGAEEGEFTLQVDGNPTLEWEFTIEDTKVHYIRVENNNGTKKTVLEAWVQKK